MWKISLPFQEIHGKSAWRRTELKGTGRVHLLKRW